MLRLANPDDDPALRRLLRENPMPGSVALSYEREPSFFIASRMEGSLSQTVVRVDQTTGALLGMGTRVIRPLYVNGQVQEIGYMGHLRADLQHPWGLSLARQLARSFATFHDLHLDGRVPFYLMSIVADNEPARRLLTSRLPGMPHAHEYARMFTYAVSPRRLKPELRLPPGVSLERGSSGQIPVILECLQHNGARMQFYPFWSIENTFSPDQTPGLQPEHFFLAVRSGRVVGCIALWDQTAFKQIVVRGYTGNMARWRRAINLLSRIMDVPYLPPIGSPISYCFASHLTIDDDDPRIFRSLLRAVYNETLRRGFNYFMLGLSELNPLRDVITRGYFHVSYLSQIYLMAWDDGLQAAARLDGRPAGLEIAIL